MKRWPVIRHLRWFFWRRRLDLWLSIWAPYGLFENPSDTEYLDAIWRGEQ